MSATLCVNISAIQDILQVSFHQINTNMRFCVFHDAALHWVICVSETLFPEFLQTVITSGFGSLSTCCSVVLHGGPIMRGIYKKRFLGLRDCELTSAVGEAWRSMCWEAFELASERIRAPTRQDLPTELLRARTPGSNVRRASSWSSRHSVLFVETCRAAHKGWSCLNLNWASFPTPTPLHKWKQKHLFAFPPFIPSH